MQFPTSEYKTEIKHPGELTLAWMTRHKNDFFKKTIARACVSKGQGGRTFSPIIVQAFPQRPSDGPGICDLGCRWLFPLSSSVGTDIDVQTVLDRKPKDLGSR